MSGKYVRVDDVMELINTSNRGSCDYFIVDQIEELCRSEKIYDLDKVVSELDKASDYYEFDEQGMEHVQMLRLVDAIEIVKGGGVDAF